ncbi:MAG: diacylglycerol kinase family lipid kinase [Verrucomicrobia bacterium]|nr:diacylglycerol kinase family lipid kinase [Verrucomicrobiota bacterium]
MKTRFIVNPRSGRSHRALAAVQAFASARLAEVTVTRRPHHATELARQALADGCQLVVAVGGDGTINEIATVLAGRDAVLGLVPCGSGNGLGRTLGVHGAIERALAILVDGRPRLIDSGLADGRAFFVTAGLGFEAVVSEEFNRHSVRGLPRYLLTAAQTWRAYQPETCTITCDGLRESRRVFTLAVANCDQYGNGARIAPGALPDDGVLDLTAIPPTTWRNGPGLAARLFLGSLNHRTDVLRLRSRRFVVERAKAGLIHVDGELHRTGASVVFEVRPRSLRVMAPAPDEPSLLPVGPAELAAAP